MHVYTLYAHPAADSFNRAVLGAFTHGLQDAGHTWEVGDLYAMDFDTDLDADQYEREVGLDPDAPVPDDVWREQEKLDRADGLAFIYPVWWSDCPAKLKGWFDRVLTYGNAYFYDDDEHRFTKIDIAKALVICSAGHSEKHLEETGIAAAMRHIMLDDRLLGVGVREAHLEILGGMMPGDTTWRDRNLERVQRLGSVF